MQFKHIAFILSSYLSVNSTTRLRLFQDNYWCVNLQGTSFHWILGWVDWGWSLMDKFPTILNQSHMKFLVICFTTTGWYWWSCSTQIPFPLLMRFNTHSVLHLPVVSYCKLGLVAQFVGLFTKVLMLLRNVLLENNSFCNLAETLFIIKERSDFQSHVEISIY